MNEMSRAYRQASVQVRTLAERNNVALTGRDIDKVVRSYGLRNDPSLINGDSVKYAHQTLARMEQELESGEMLLRCQKQSEYSFRSAATHATTDDVERLQRFARMHSNAELSSTQAEAILRSHKDLLQQPSSKIDHAITDFKTANNSKFIAARSSRGIMAASKAVAKTAALGMSMAQTSNDENGSGLDTRGAFGEGRDIFNESRKLAYRKRLEAEKGLDYVKNPKSTGRNLGRRSPRQNKIVGTTGRNAAKTTKTRAAFSKAKVKWNPYVRTAAERSAGLRRGAAVSNMISKKKAKDAAIEGAKQGTKAAMSKWTEGKAVGVAAKFFLALFLACALVTVIFAVILIVVIIVTETYAAQNLLTGDWYDSNAYKSKNFVEITQDLQRKYYDDCLMIAYEVGADTPKPEDVRINWKEVYSLWAAIVRYRAGNKKMQTIHKDGDTEVTGYSLNSPVYNLKSGDQDRVMFNSGDDYLQDFYLAFYSMYYDLKASDYHGNPLVYDVIDNEWYYPYYPDIGEVGTGVNYEAFNETNGYPLKGKNTGNIICTTADYRLLYREKNQWKIETHGRYYFAYATDVGTGTDGDGFFNRGRPKVTCKWTDVEEKFEPPETDADIYFDITWHGSDGESLPENGYRVDFAGSGWYSFTCNESAGGYWTLDAIYQKSGDGTRHRVSDTSDRIAICKALGKNIRLYAHTLYCGSCKNGTAHTHKFSNVSVGSYKDLFWKPDPVIITYQDVTLQYPSPTAITGLDALHQVYDRVYNKDYGFNGSKGTPYYLGLTFFLGGSHVVGDDIAVEMGTLYTSTSGINIDGVHEGILVVLDQIFDRAAYYPWASWGYYPRWASGAPESLYAYGLPGAKSGSRDYYDTIKSNLNQIQNSENSSYGATLPADSYLFASFEADTSKYINTYAVGDRDPEKKQYSSFNDLFGTSVVNVQYCFPFCVRYKPCTGVGSLNAGSSWEKDALYGSVDGAWDCISFSWYDMHPHWTSTTYLLYRYFASEQHMSPPAVCGILGALELETNFSASGYKSLTKDNNGCYALGLLQWNEGIKAGTSLATRPYGDHSTEWNGDKGHTNLYNNTLCSWCASHNLNWKNAGAQLKFITECCTNGGPAGDYRDGVKWCQTIPLTMAGSFGSNVHYSAYTNSDGNPTFSEADSAATYEACFWWGVYVEKGVEQIGGTCNDSWHRAGYGANGSYYDPSLLFDIESHRAYNNYGQYAYTYYSEKYPYWTGLNIDKQRMVAAHIFLRYIAASDPSYYSVAYYDPDVWGEV